MYSGGIADKTGNRYEARWLTYQLLDLLHGEALSVTIERIGDGEDGFEFLVERPGVSEWHQCKRQTSAATWTIAALANEGVLGNFSGKLGLIAAERCIFVSTDVAKQIKRLEEKRRIATSLTEFERALSETETTDWQSLKDHLGVDGEGTLDWLAHCQFHAISEDILAKNVANRLAIWFDGDPSVIVGAIRGWTEEDETLNRSIDRTAFLAFLAGKEFTLKQYELDRTLPGRLKDRTRAYDSSYSPLGAGQFRIKRRESDLLTEALLGSEELNVVVLVGPAGSGKSGIVRDAVARVAEKGVLQLAFRVDQIGEPLSITQLGTSVIDVADSPAVVLEKLAGEGRAILYIDQADAVSEMSGRLSQVRRLILDLVNQAKSYRHIRLVFSCRTFDFENDAQFHEIAKSNRTVRIDVPLYDWDRDVAPTLADLGILIEDNPRIKSPLVQPIALSLAAQLAASGDKDLRDVETLSGLFDRLIQDREREIRKRFAPPWSLYQVLEALAAEMSERQELVAPVRILDRFAGARDRLQQEDLIVINGPMLSLLHESLFDHLHARAFAEGKQSLVEFLTAKEQTLFRRTQVRQILATERDVDVKRFREDLRGVLMSDAVRTHIKDFVLRWLGTISQPTIDEWEILGEYAARQGDCNFPQSISIVLFGQPAWFDLLSERGLVADWLRGDDSAERSVLNLARSVAGAGSARLVAELNCYLDVRPDRAGLLLEHFYYVGPKGPDPALADSIIRALGMIKDIEDLSHGEGLFDLNSSWVEHAPEDAARILSANFDAWYRLDATGTPFKSYEGGSGPSHHLIELTKVRPVAMLDAVLPAMVITMQRMPGEGAAPRQDMVWHWRRHEADESLIEFLDIVRAAFARAAVSAPDEVARLIGIIDPANEITSLYLLLETVAHNGKQLAGLLAQQKDNPALFEAGPQGSPAHSAAVALSAVWDWLDPADRDHFETRILGLWSEFDDVRWALSLRDPEKNRFLKKSETDIRDIARRYLAQSGRRQWSVLRTIDASRLSPTVCERLALFERKFASQDPESPSASRSGSVHSPIAPDRAAHMSDDAWISAFGGMGEGDRGWSEWGFRGGAYELARVLQARVKQQPDRFVELASRMPATADPSFINGIVMGLSEANPTPTQTERLLELIDQGDGPAPDDRSVVWLIRATKGEKGDRALAFVLQAATARDNDTAVGDISRPANDKPEPEFKRALALGSKLESEAVNATRGAALIEIGSQSWASKDKFEKYRPIVEPMIGSDMPDFLHASLNPMLVAAIKHDRAIATDWIARTAKKSPSGLFTSNGRRALFNLDVLEHDAAAPIIIGLADSTDSLEQAIGCLLVTHRSLDDGRWNAKVDELIERGPVQRAAVAEIAVAYVAQAAHFSRASSWLIRFFEDDDETVRTTAVDCFRRIDPDEMASYVQLYEAYVGSKYFNAERTSFLHRLDKAPAAMSDVVLGLIEKTVAVAKSRGPKNTSLSTYQIWDPLLRIYASSSADPVRLAKTLDIVDDMVTIDSMGSNKLNAAC